MKLYSREELSALPEYQSLKDALKRPADVVRLRLYGEGKKLKGLEKVRELRNLQSLSISLLDVRPLLENLDELSQLQELVLQACEIDRFPQGILSLGHMRSLTINNSGLDTLPSEIGQLQDLEALRLNQNRLSAIPAEIGRLNKLTILALRFNRIGVLPESIGDLRSLEYLSLGANSLTDLPGSLWRLPNLRRLDLSSNKLVAIPEDVDRLKALDSLDLAGNPFESLPACLGAPPLSEHVDIEAEKRPLFMDWIYPPSDRAPRCEVTALKLLAEPGHPLVADLPRRIRSAGLEEFEAIILSKARDAITIETTTPEDYATIGGSRFGGFPDLPTPGHFPETDGAYWIFLAQIDLAEIAPLNDYLPRSGLLSFFVDSTESLNARVLFHEGSFEQLATVRHSGAEAMFAPDDDYTRDPHRLKFTRVVALPPAPPWKCEWGSPAEKAYDEITESVDHQINGYTYTQHESPQQQAAAKMRGKAEEWVPLLKLGWDDRVKFCFWDAGTLTFCIHEEDLRRDDFSHVQVSLESS